jgi:hypothetical protein
MNAPTTIKEADGRRWTLENGRPVFMRIAIGFIAPIALALVGVTAINDFREGRWFMLAARCLFALLVLMSAVFSLFGAERLAIEGDELVWRRGRSQVRRAHVNDVEKLERQGNHLRVHVRGQEHPIIVGVGLRQQPAAIAWLAERVQAAIRDIRARG